MRVTITAVGRLRGGPEAELIADYLARFDRTGRALGLGPCGITEVEARRGGGAAEEAALLMSSIPKGARVLALDERGRRLSSPEFAEKLRDWADTGTRDLVCLIGGADGLTPDLRARADFRLSFGSMVWPHILARVMLTEQLYRAASILARSPYHRA